MAGIFTKKREFPRTDNGISSVETILLGGIKQTILIQGANIGNPVLLMIHGGPSLPVPGVSSKGQDYTMITNTKELVQHYTVVFWDQRGTGRSYHDSIPQESLTIGQFVDDANELTDYLRNRFNQEKIFLAGHSWGSTIGLELAYRFPHKYHFYFGFSQIISWTENDRLAMKWIKEEAKRRGNNKALKELESVGEPPYTESFKQWSVLRKYQRSFSTIIYQDDTIKHPGLVGLTLRMLQSPDYTFRDIYNTFYKGFKLIYWHGFIESLGENNFMESVKELDVPVTFIHGRKDFHVNGSLVEIFHSGLKAYKGKNLIWAEKSAHAFHPDDTKMIEEYLIKEAKNIH